LIVPEDTYRSLGQIVAQIKAHLKFQKGLGIYTFLSRKEIKPSITLEAIRSDLGDCTRCRLHKERQNLVFGEGNPHACLVFVGEAPGREEDLQGRPFVGPAGELLTRIIEAIDLRREEVYIANIVKCRPPQNRNPQPDEIRTCLPFLRKQLAAIRPRIICALGTFAAQTLLQTEERISLLRGQFYTYEGALLMPTYHPAFLLRNPQFKRDVWEDMKMIREEYKKG
jgi:uracil-DNA glycosylase family 4